MIRALSTAASGMQAEQQRLDVTANNIANSSTVGFKKARAEFQDLMYQTIKAPGAATGGGMQSPTGLQVGMGVRTVSTQRMHGQGSFRQTGNPLDVAIEGNGFLVVAKPDGSLAYTRDGQLRLNAEGRLVNSDGFALASEVSIPPDATSVTIAVDGTVTAQVPGDTAPVEVGTIELATFANPAGLLAQGRGLYSETAASGTAITGKPGESGIGLLQQGALEVSNVSVVEEMIDLISGQRAYEMNSKVIQTVDEMLNAASRLR
ncbi:MAG: flagellar basal-body rod protein FlgG [Deltaproteobacteria bacterium]|nr:flagellar basal-body rod protein FlgG [Deltaproteobacteria bacterium]